MQISSAAINAQNQRVARQGEVAGMIAIKQDLQAQQAIAQMISASTAQNDRQVQDQQTRPAPAAGRGQLLDIVV